MTTAGYAKAGDGFFAQAGTRLSMGLMAFSQGSGEKEGLILAAAWKRAGFDTPLTILNATQSQDVQIVSTYPALRIDQTGIEGLTGSLSKWGEATTSLDRNERNNAMVQALKFLSERAIYFPLYQGYLVAAQAGSLVGPTTGDAGVALWNVETWTWK